MTARIVAPQRKECGSKCGAHPTAPIRTDNARYLKNVMGGGAWGGCVYDVEAIVAALLTNGFGGNRVQPSSTE
jgi:hypothetical protein